MTTAAVAATQPARTRRTKSGLAYRDPRWFRSRTPLPFTAAFTAALPAHDYVQAGEVRSSVFAVPRESAALVRDMVMENDRLWSIPREMVLRVERPAIDRLTELTLPTLIMLGEL